MQSCDTSNKAWLEDWGWCSVSIRNGCVGSGAQPPRIVMESTSDLWVKLKYMGLLKKKDLSVER